MSIVDRRPRANRLLPRLRLHSDGAGVRGLTRMLPLSSAGSCAPVGTIAAGTEAPPSETFLAHDMRFDDTDAKEAGGGRADEQNGIFRAVTRSASGHLRDGLSGAAWWNWLSGGWVCHEFADLGLVATGIEVRESNYRNCQRVEARRRPSRKRLHQG